MIPTATYLATATQHAIWSFDHCFGQFKTHWIPEGLSSYFGYPSTDTLYAILDGYDLCYPGMDTIYAILEWIRFGYPRMNTIYASLEWIT